MPKDLDDAWLRPMHESFVEALRSNDLEALCAYYTREALLLAPGQAITAGREQIGSYWKEARRIQKLAFSPAAVGITGTDAVREAGNLIVTMAGQGGKAFNTVAKYIILWVQEEGVWKIDTMAWNGTGAGGKGRRGRRADGRRMQGARAEEGGRAGGKRKPR